MKISRLLHLAKAGHLLFQRLSTKQISATPKEEEVNRGAGLFMALVTLALIGPLPGAIYLAERSLTALSYPDQPASFQQPVWTLPILEACFPRC